MHYQVHARGVDDALVVGDVEELARHGAATLEEEAVAEFHDVGLVDRSDALASELARVLERELRDPRRGLLGDDLDALDNAGDDLVLEPGIEVFGVFADDDQIDALEPRFDA